MNHITNMGKSYDQRLAGEIMVLCNTGNSEITIKFSVKLSFCIFFAD